MRTCPSIPLALALALLLAGLPRRAAAEPDPLHDFFVGERDSGALFLNAGVTTAVLGAALRVQDAQLAHGAAYAIFTIAALQIGGGAMLMSSQGKERQLAAARARDPIAFAQSERLRLRRIDLQYKLIEVLEGAVMLSGLSLAAVARTSGRDQLAGAGLGLLLQGGLMLSLDLTAHHRARRYQATLR